MTKPYQDWKNILQVPMEIEGYCDVLRESNVKSYLEIGSKYGGSLWLASQALQKGARIVAVDMPKGTKVWQESQPSLEMCVRDLRAEGFDAHLIWGKSQDLTVIKKVLALGPYDAIMIDADHRMPWLEEDWDNYHYMTNGLVAFHDIAWRRAPEWNGTRIDVPEFWNSIKGNYKHVEFKACPTGKNNGIGILWKT